MDQIQGKGNWNRATREGLFDKLKKFYGEHYKDPKEILPPPVPPTDITGRDIEASLPNQEENSDQQPSVA
jgi:hypothetical protein